MSDAAATYLSCPLDYRYGRDEMKRIFSETGKLERILRVEASLARAHAAVGDIPREAADEITRHATLDDVTPARVREIEAEIRHDLMAVVRALAERCDGDAGGYVHLGATSYDIIDSANALMFEDGLDLLEAGCERLLDALASLAREHRDTVMLGRTHGQAATPITFGLKMAVFLLEVDRHLTRLREARPRIVVGKMAGATGSMAGLGPNALELQDLVGRDLGIAMEDGPTQIVQRDRFNEVLQILANLATSLERFATEVRNLQRSEIHEAAEGFDVSKQVGSSTMAQKQNPVRSERVSGLARLVRAQLGPAYENSVQWHERDLSNSSAERFLLPHAFVLTDYILQESAVIFEELRVFPETMQANLARFPGAMAESVMLALVQKGVGRQDAHELVRQAAMVGGSFREALAADAVISAHLSGEELDAAMDPAAYTGQSGALVDRALAKVQRA